MTKKMNILKTLSILAVVTTFAGCQQSSTALEPITVLAAPASDDAETLDLTKLRDGFPIIAEMVLPAKPARCGLSKANRFGAEANAPAQDFASRYVFSYQGVDEATGEPLYRVGINGVVRTVKQSGSADRDQKKVRYYKTIDAPEVEVLVAIESGGNDTKFTGIVGRIKAWDAGVPLMCGYNRIEVVGDCDL